MRINVKVEVPDGDMCVDRRDIRTYIPKAICRFLMDGEAQHECFLFTEPLPADETKCPQCKEA